MSGAYIPKRAMFIFAHPDDIEFSSAGTAALWAKHGSDVLYVVLTDGNIGSHDPDMTAEKLAAIRREEQTAAATVAGAKVTYMGEPDGLLQPTPTLRKKLVRLIRQHKPNVVVCGDPTYYYGETYINHPDHRNAALAALEAVFPSADSPLIFPELVTEEGLEPHKINYVYMTSNGPEATLLVDISETIDTKLAALREHKSQLKEWDPEERMRNWTAEVGKKAGFSHAEGFKKITLREPEPEQPEEDPNTPHEKEEGFDRTDA